MATDDDDAEDRLVMHTYDSEDNFIKMLKMLQSPSFNCVPSFRLSVSLSVCANYSTIGLVALPHLSVTGAPPACHRGRMIARRRWGSLYDHVIPMFMCSFISWQRRRRRRRRWWPRGIARMAVSCWKLYTRVEIMRKEMSAFVRLNGYGNNRHKQLTRWPRLWHLDGF